MDKHYAYNILQSIHSRLVIAETFTNIKEQVGADNLKSATNDLYKFIQSEFKEELRKQEQDYMK